MTWVDPAGPAYNELMPTDIVESVNGRAVANADDWRAHTRNIANGEEVKLRVRSDGETRDVAIKAAAVVEVPEDSSLGLRVRTVPRVAWKCWPSSRNRGPTGRAFARAILITVFGGQKAPAAAQIVRIFDGAARQTRLLVALSRGGEHHVVVLEKIATTP